MDVDTTPRTTGHHRRDVTLRISQVVSACTFCKSRKIKCDGVAPACGCCTKFGRASSCSLADGAVAARHSHDYVAYIQSRIRQTRENLAALHLGRPEEPAPPLSGGGPVTSTATGTITSAAVLSEFDFNAVDSSADLPRHDSSYEDQHHHHQNQYQHTQQDRHQARYSHGDRQQSAIDTLIADIGALPISTSSHAASTTAVANGPTLSTVLLAAASKLPLLSIAPLQLQADAGTQADRLSACLPEQLAALKLAQHYIQQVYPRLPFFSIQGFWAQFHHVYAVSSGSDAKTVTGVGSGTGGSTKGLNSGYSYFTVLLVLAIATSSLSRSADSMISNQARRLFQAGLQFRESAILPNTIVGVQSLLFLIQFATLNPSVLDSWYLIGVGMRNCVDLGLHQDPQPPLDAAISPSLLETRRRLWWSMYSFDRSLSIGCGRPTEIADALIHVQLPSFRIESSSTTEVEIEGYVQRYRALQLQSEIYDALNHRPEASRLTPTSSPSSIVSDLRRKLDAWQLDNRPERNHQTLADSEWLISKMLLFRPCRLLPERGVAELGELWVSARGFTALYRQLVETNGIFYVQVACEKVYWTGLVMLYSYWKLWARGETHVVAEKHIAGGEQDDNVAEHLQSLDLWKATKDVTFILQTLSERWEDGKILSAKFDTVSARVIELLDGGGGAVLQDKENMLVDTLPTEVVTLSSYASLVSIWASRAEHLHSGLGMGQSDELQDLVAKMI